MTRSIEQIERDIDADFEVQDKIKKIILDNY